MGLQQPPPPNLLFVPRNFFKTCIVSKQLVPNFNFVYFPAPPPKNATVDLRACNKPTYRFNSVAEDSLKDACWIKKYVKNTYAQHKLAYI